MTAVFIWFLALAGAALFYNRSIEFWPPNIGADKSLTAEVRVSYGRTSKDDSSGGTLRVALMSQIWKAREQAAAFQQKGEDRGAEAYWKNASDLALELKQSDERLAERLRVLEQRLADLQRRL